jgi:hypothetical protein
MKPDPNEAIGSSYRNLSGTSGPAGTRLENEIVLAEQLGLSRPTMRRAIEYLVDRGLLVRRRGVGTQVVQPKVRGPVELSSLYDDLRAAWREPRTDVLAFTVERPSKVVAEVVSSTTCRRGWSASTCRYRCRWRSFLYPRQGGHLAVVGPVARRDQARLPHPDLIRVVDGGQPQVTGWVSATAMPAISPAQAKPSRLIRARW